MQVDGNTKVPYYIHLNDQPIFAFAGLWDSSKTDTGKRIESVTHITLPANGLLGEIHNTQHRMPAILEKADREAWLTGTPEEAWETLTPYPDDLMVAWHRAFGTRYLTKMRTRQPIAHRTIRSKGAPTRVSHR